MMAADAGGACSSGEAELLARDAPGAPAADQARYQGAGFVIPAISTVQGEDTRAWKRAVPDAPLPSPPPLLLLLLLHAKRALSLLPAAPTRSPRPLT